MPCIYQWKYLNKLWLLLLLLIVLIQKRAFFIELYKVLTKNISYD